MYISFNGFAQTSTFDDEANVISFMDGKTFSNSSNGLDIQYGYISSYNTYGIKVTNKYGDKYYYINCNIDTYGTYADIYGMSPNDGSNFGFRLYKTKLIVGRGEASEVTFYLK
jgi:hypothetical protein